MVLALDNIGRDLLRTRIEWVENCMENDINAWATKCAGCKVREPTQSARANAKCVGCAMNARDAKCAEAREMRRPRFNCAGRNRPVSQ